MPDHLRFLSNEQFTCYTDRSLYDVEMDPEHNPPNGFPLFGSVRDCQRCFTCCSWFCPVLEMTFKRSTLEQTTSDERILVTVDPPEQAEYITFNCPSFLKLGFPIARRIRDKEIDNSYSAVYEIVSVVEIGTETLKAKFLADGGILKEHPKVSGIAMTHHNDYYWTPTIVAGLHRVAFDLEEDPVQIREFSKFEPEERYFDGANGADFQPMSCFRSLVLHYDGVEYQFNMRLFEKFRSKIHLFSPMLTAMVLYELMRFDEDEFERTVDAIPRDILGACYLAECSHSFGSILCTKLNELFGFEKELEREVWKVSLSNATMQLLGDAMVAAYDDGSKYTAGKRAYKLSYSNDGRIFYFIPEMTFITAEFRNERLLRAYGGTGHSQYFVFKEEPDSPFIIYKVNYDKCEYFIKTWEQNFEFMLNLTGVLTSGRIEFFENGKRVVFCGIFNAFTPVRGHLLDLESGSKRELRHIVSFCPFKCLFALKNNGVEEQLSVYEPKKRTSPGAMNSIKAAFKCFQ